MELDNYRNFLAIVESGSFTAAADFVHIAQPALSKQIKNLESFFGTKLIITQRGSRQILLTDAGRVLYQKAKYMCSLEDVAKDEIDQIAGGVSGTLRFSIATSRAPLLIGSTLKEFHHNYPQIRFELFEASIAEQTKQLLDGTTELGIFTVPVTNQDNFDVLFCRDEDLVAVAHKESVFLDMEREEIDITELSELPLSLTSGSANIVLDACAARNIRPNIIAINTSRVTTLAWAQFKTAVAILPVEPDEMVGKSFTIKRIPALKSKIFKTIVKVKGRPLSAAAKNFLKFYARIRGSQQVCDLEKILMKEK